MSLDYFELLQRDVASKLSSEAWFNDVPVLPYRPFCVDTDSASGAVAQEEVWRVKRNGSRSGLGVLVHMPRLQVRHSNISGPQSWVRMTVSVFEQPAVNDSASGLNAADTGWKTAEKVAMRVAEVLHHWRYDGCNMLVIEGDWLTVNREHYAKAVKGYDCAVYGCMFRNVSSKAPQVSITIAAGSCTLDATGEDSIRYTVDGSLPTADSTLYSAPFAVASGTVVRAVSLKSGSYASDVAQQTA